MILVAGGSGTLGNELVRRLLGRGLRVRVLTRDAPRARLAAGERLEVVEGDVRLAATLAPAVQGVATVVSAVHGFAGPGRVSPASVDRDGNANLVSAAASAGAEVVLMSVVGAAADSPMELFRMKHAAELRLLASGIPATIVRATAFLETWLGLLRETAGRSGRPLVFGRGDNPINFVSAIDVAALVERAVIDPSTRGQRLEIGGPENLTLTELATAVQRGAGGTGRLRHVPRSMLRAMAVGMRPFRPDHARQAQAALVMDRADMTFDASATRLAFPELPCTALADLPSGLALASAPHRDR
jgi:NADH dehydrogenase